MTKNQIRTLVRVLLLVGTIVSLFFVPWPILFAWLSPLPNTVQAQVTAALDHDFDGIIVYVDQAGQPPAFYTAGWHDRDQKIPARPDAYFKLASISKLYVALAVTKLVKEQTLSLDKTLAEYRPDLVGRIEYADQITLAMMVQHRSGIPNYTDFAAYWAVQPDTRAESLEFALDLPANFKPNTDYRYSNTNYLLLTQIMDQELGRPFHQYIREKILLPHGLNHTFHSISAVAIKDVMSGYYVGYTEDLKTEDRGMIATAQDVGTFLRKLNDGSIFDEGEQAIYDSIYVYEHTGLMPGYQSIAKYHREIDTIVIQFINTTNFDGYNFSLSEIVYDRILKIIKTKPPVPSD